jgi:GNAT acetyltransferase-like protein
MTGNRLFRPHSRAFVQRWRDMVCGVFGWQRRGPFVEIPSLVSSEKILSYVPLLNYSDLTALEGSALGEEAGERPYLVRTLAGAPPEQGFAPGDMVTMRLALDGDVWKNRLRDVCRNQVRKAENGPLELRSGRSENLAASFYELFRETMHRYGVPVFPLQLLRSMVAETNIDVRFYLAFIGEQPAAGIVRILDKGLAWIPWGASRREFLTHCPNHLVYWAAIKEAREQGAGIFDFGRSPYGEATYSFKKKWGAEPVGLHYLRPGNEDLYSRYALAQKVWSHTPRPLVDWAGPKLCRYLADL